MTLDKAIQHCEEVAKSKTKQVENGDWEKGSSTERDCIACASEHRQLAEWLKELKAYKEQNGKRMNKVEKERLIKKDIASIENKVRHVFNQGYEMGVKAYKENMSSRSEIPNTCDDAVYIDGFKAGYSQARFDLEQESCDKTQMIDKSNFSMEQYKADLQSAYDCGKASVVPCGDAISRKYILDLIATKGANLDDDLLIVEQWIQDAPSVNPHPIECGDAISRQAVLDAFWKLNIELSPTAIWTIQNMVKDVPSVSPQQRTGRWIAQDIHNCHTDFKCSECGYIHSFMHLYGKPTADYTYCPNCGAKMEVEDAD